MRLTWRKVRNGALYVALSALAAALLVGWQAGRDVPAAPSSGIIDERFPREWMGARMLAAPPKDEPRDFEVRAANYLAHVVSHPLVQALQSVERVRLPPPRATNRNWVFSDSQIASVKSRLRLTAEQEKHWPAMEAALRELAWEQGRSGTTLNAQGVQRLTEVAEGFLAQLNEAQKREVRVLANVAGLNLGNF